MLSERIEECKRQLRIAEERLAVHGTPERLNDYRQLVSVLHCLKLVQEEQK